MSVSCAARSHSTWNGVPSPAGRAHVQVAAARLQAGQRRPRPRPPDGVHHQVDRSAEGGQLVGQRLLAQHRHPVSRGGDLRQPLRITAGRDHPLGAAQPRELHDGRPQRPGRAEHEDAVARLEPGLPQRQVRARADHPDRRRGDAVELVRDRDAGRAVGQQQLGQPAVDAGDQARRAGRAHPQPLVGPGHDRADGLDGGHVRQPRRPGPVLTGGNVHVDRVQGGRLDLDEHQVAGGRRRVGTVDHARCGAEGVDNSGLHDDSSS